MTMHRPAMIVDLDGTLYPATARLELGIKPAMVDTAATTLNISRERAHAVLAGYREQYGSSVIGLVRHEGVDGDAFLDEVYRCLDLGGVHVAPGLRDAVLELGTQRELHLATNSSRGHAGRVLGMLGIADCFRSVSSTEDWGYLRKPKAEPYRHILLRQGLSTTDCMVVDDSYLNLETAAGLGMRTALVSNGVVEPPFFWEMHKEEKHLRPDFVDVAAWSFAELPAAIRQLETRV